MTTTETSEAPIGSQDVEALTPEHDVITLSSGFVVRVEPLKTRGLFKLLKIATRGAGPILMNTDLDFNNQETFMGQLLAVIMMAIPEAEQETIEFIQAMVVPKEFNENPRTGDAKQKNKELFERLISELDDPEIEDTISIIETIVRNESGDIQALGKRLGSIIRTQMKTQSLTSSGEAKN